MEHSEEKNWEAYRTDELHKLSPFLSQRGYALDELQPHLLGERHLTGPLGSGRKLLLLGKDRTGKRVVIKASSEPKGIQEIEHERLCRDVLEKIHFAYQVFNSPRELVYARQDGYVVSVTEFIEQAVPFTERSLKEQFALSINAFKAQESAHATTYSHIRLIRNTFGEMRAPDYLKNFDTYAGEIASLAPHAPQTLLERAREELRSGGEMLEQYGGFLTHWDFIPQNFRVNEGKLFLLDHSSLRFGNKYEGWARFINFMELYNPPLVRALVEYVRENRTPEESEALRLMRIYRLGELIRYYAGWLSRTQGQLQELAEARIVFWGNVLKAVLERTEVPPELVEEYKKTRDRLRSEEEKVRQRGLH